MMRAQQLALPVTIPDLQGMKTADSEAPPVRTSWRTTVHQVIFGTETPAGKLFDLVLIVLIALSVIVVSLETVQGLPPYLRTSLRLAEWIFTAFFLVEYILRLVSVRRPWAYALSFFGLIDLLAILPTLISIFIPGAQALLVVRVIRMLRIFRILKLARFLNEATTLSNAMRASSRKIFVFMLSVGTMVIIIGSMMFVVEGPSHGFTSIPRSMYWAVVTLTTVGYGDIAPQTPLGQTLASFVMILGYGIIAVPTGIVTAELAQSHTIHLKNVACPECSRSAHETDARFCRGCGTKLPTF